jgi:hypothetical protein
MLALTVGAGLSPFKEQQSMKKFIVAFGLMCLIATPAFGVGETTFKFGPSSETLLLRSQTTTIGEAGFCMDLLEDLTASIAGEACDITGSNEVIWPHNAQVTKLVVRHIVTATASDVCAFGVEVAGTLQGTAAVVATDAAAGAVTTTAYKINLADGALVGLVVGESTSCASSGEYVVELWGRWVAADSF